MNTKDPEKSNPTMYGFHLGISKTANIKYTISDAAALKNYIITNQ